MRFNSKYPFYVVDLAFFVVTNIIVITFLKDRIANFSISWVHLVVLGLAVYRTAHVVSNEKITEPLREPFTKKENHYGKLVEVPKTRGVKGAFGNLLYCSACTGIWISMVLVYSYIRWPSIVFIFAIILALSGAERLLTVLFDFLKPKS